MAHAHLSPWGEHPQFQAASSVSADTQFPNIGQRALASCGEPV